MLEQQTRGLGKTFVRGEGGAVERGVIAEVALIHLGAFLQQPGNQFEICFLSGDVERGCAVAVAGVDQRGVGFQQFDGLLDVAFGDGVADLILNGRDGCVRTASSIMATISSYSRSRAMVSAEVASRWG